MPYIGTTFNEYKDIPEQYLYILYLLIIICFIYIYDYIEEHIKNTDVKNTEMSKYYLGQILDKECLEIEYKEFCIKDKKLNIPSIYKGVIRKDITETETLNFALSGEITNHIMRLIHKNVIESYLMKYIPKYISSFCNSCINGEFIIGVNDDDHEITGIPYLTSSKYNLNKEMIKSVIKNQFKNLRCINVNDEEVLNAIDIELIEVDYKSELSEKYLEDDDKDIKQQINNYLKQVNDYYKAMEKYIIDKRDNWRIYYDRYHIGLQTFIDNIELRIELAKYIEKHNHDNKYDHIIRELYTNKKIIVPVGYIVKILKLQDNNLVYWLTLYRDLMKNNAISYKPKKPQLILQNYIYPDILLQRISLIKRTISQNKRNRENGLKFYLIKIKINGERFKDKKYKNICIQYKDNLKVKNKVYWVTGHRCVINNDPYCSYKINKSDYF
jgi:hypothetical protein